MTMFRNQDLQTDWKEYWSKDIPGIAVCGIDQGRNHSAERRKIGAEDAHDMDPKSTVEDTGRLIFDILYSCFSGKDSEGAEQIVGVDA